MTRKEQQELEASIRETISIVKSDNDASATSLFDDEEESIFDEVDKKHKPAFLSSFIPSKTDNFFQILNKIFVLVAYIAFIIAVIYIINYFAESMKAQQTQKEIRHMYVVESLHKDMSVPIKNDLTVTETHKKLVLTDTAKAFLEINPDTVGYIRIPDTKIDNMVVKGTDNDYYLNHNVYGEKRQAGSIFVDYRCTIGTYYDSPNIIIYGHNQKDNTMFGHMDLYKSDIEYWKENPIIYFNTNYENNAYLIIATFVTNEKPEHDNGYVFDYWNYINFNDDYKFSTWKQEVLDRTLFTTGYDFDESDEYITLSTCSSEWEPARHVIIARKLRSNEDVENIDTEKWEANPNPRWPQVYYNIYENGHTWSKE